MSWSYSLNGLLSIHLQFFPCITIHQTSIFRDPRRQHAPSYSNGGMSYFLPSGNIYQQTRYIHHTNISEHNTTSYIPFFSHQTHILNLTQKSKTMKHCQYHSDIILLRIIPFTHQNHQKFMSNTLQTWIATMDLTLLLLLSFPLFLN